MEKMYYYNNLFEKYQLGENLSLIRLYRPKSPLFNKGLVSLTLFTMGLDKFYYHFLTNQYSRESNADYDQVEN